MGYEAEQKIIGSILLNNDCLDEISFLRPEMFQGEQYGKMFAVCRKMIQEGRAVDIEILADNIVDDFYPPQAAAADVGTCVRNTATSFEAKRYARNVYTAYRSRVFRNAINNVTGNEDSLDSDIQALTDILDSIRTDGDNGSKSLPQIVRENKDKYFKDDERPKMMMGLPKLDEMLGGLEGGDLILIGARPAVGKSAFATQITSHFAELGKKVGYFNLEMQEKQVYERFVAARSGIELTRIRRAIAFQNDEERRFREANEYLERQKGIIITTGAKRISEIRIDAKRQAYDVIIIDYMQLVRPDRAYGANRYAEVGAISHAVKSLAMEMNIPVIGLCQLNRLSEARETKEPTMAELRESGDFEQDASVIMLLWNTDKDDRSKKCLKVDKSRQGRIGKVDLHFDGNRMKFTEDDGGGFEDADGYADVVFD